MNKYVIKVTSLYKDVITGKKEHYAKEGFVNGFWHTIYVDKHDATVYGRRKAEKIVKKENKGNKLHGFESIYSKEKVN